MPTAQRVCEQFSLNDVDLEYTDADFQNLTTFKLFQQTYGPRFLAKNSKVPRSKVVMLVAAKWREFGSLGKSKEAKETSEDHEGEEELHDDGDEEEVHSQSGQSEVENVADDPMSQSDPTGNNFEEEKQKKKKKRRTELLHSSSTFLNPEAPLQPCKEERTKLGWQLECQFRSTEEFGASAIYKEIRYVSFAN